MIRYNKELQSLAVALSFLAGYVDALGYRHYGAYFVSFMSGNSTKFSVGLAEDPPMAYLAGGLIGLFVLGVMLGESVARFAGRRRQLSVLVFVSILLVVAAGLAQIHLERLGALFMVLAMGAENAMFQHNGEVTVGLTYVTGAMVKFAQGAVTALFGGDRWRWVPYGLLWVGLVAGAFAGAMIYPMFHLKALWGAAAGAAGLSIAVWLLPRPAIRAGLPRKT